MDDRRSPPTASTSSHAAAPSGPASAAETNAASVANAVAEATATGWAAAHAKSDSARRDDLTLVQDADSLTRALRLSERIARAPADVPGYTITSSLGEGAFGSVWLAKENNTGKLVAIKFYMHRRGLDWSLLNREVEKLAVLYTSRNIVGLLEVGWDNDPPYYVMEYLENGSLAGHLADGPLPVAEAVRITTSILHGLVHAHGCGILHCDLKPANILLDGDFQIRLCDFGQSRLCDERTGALGTLFYMAPEQAALNAVPDARWDVYALGALLYQMLVGQVPYRTPENEQAVRAAKSLDEQLAAYRRILERSPRPGAHRHAPGVDKRLVEIVDRCLQVDPARRYANPQAVLDALKSRERQRARRPLFALGIVGPALLLLALSPIIGEAMRRTVKTAERNLTLRALESDALSVRLLAQGVEREIVERTAELLEIAEDPDVRQAIKDSAERPWSERTALRDALGQWKAKVDRHSARIDREPDTSWFLTDAVGNQRWREPFGVATIDQNYAHRDYYHGRNVQFDRDKLPADIGPIREPHVSQVFVSEVTNRYMVAISVPVWDGAKDGPGRVIGVLARTSHLGELLSAYEARIGGGERGAVSRVTALVDSRDGRLLSHPWMTQAHLERLSPDEFKRLRLSDDTLARMHRVPPDDPERAIDPDFAADRNDRYEDPVALIDRDDAAPYRDVWLAAFSPVGETGWTAVVQEHRGAALAPIDAMRSRLVKYSAWAVAIACVLAGLLWYFVTRAINEGGFRNWARRRADARSGGTTLTATSVK